MSIVLVECLRAVGHINLYREWLKTPEKYFGWNGEAYLEVELKTYQSYKKQLGEFNDGVKFSQLGKEYTGKRKVCRKLHQIYSHFISFQNVELNQRIIFLAYDTYALGVAILLRRLLFRKIPKDIWVVEHNNLDGMQNSSFKKLLYRLMSAYVRSFVFESYILTYVQENFNRAGELISHPTRLYEGSHNAYGARYIFVPSRDIDEAEFFKLYHFAINAGLLLVTKNHAFLGDRSYPSMHRSNYFDDYASSFMGSEYIGIPVNYQNRVSAVAYEAIANGKKILMPGGKLSAAMKKRCEALVYNYYDEETQSKEHFSGCLDQ